MEKVSQIHLGGTWETWERCDIYSVLVICKCIGYR
nr:MAG TPA: hypothetical protein [Caudoviricetes sp.]